MVGSFRIGVMDCIVVFQITLFFVDSHDAGVSVNCLRVIPLAAPTDLCVNFRTLWPLVSSISTGLALWDPLASLFQACAACRQDESHVSAA